MRLLSTFLVLLSLFGLVSAQNPNCLLTVPALPLTAQGLATPYLLNADNINNGPCNQLNGGQTTFVQGAVLDQTNSQVFVYNPLVIDMGTTPAITPVPPTLPAQHVVGLWFGFNGNILTLVDDGTGSLAAGLCTNKAGVDASQFGEFAYCNAIAWFAAANHAIEFGGLVVPPTGVSPKDGFACPTLHDWTMIDQDPSDQVDTSYIVNTATMTLAQDTPANRVQLGVATPQAGVNFLANPSDNGLLAALLGPTLGCQPWTAPDLAAMAQGQTQMLPAVPLSELSAAKNQLAPKCLIFNNDPMVRVNQMMDEDINKVNAYRLGVNQPVVNSPIESDSINACNRYYALAVPRIMLDKQFTMNTPSPNPGVATTLFGFLVNRMNAAVAAGVMNCVTLLNLPPPFNFQAVNGVVQDATVTVNPNAVITTLTGVTTRTAAVGQILLTGNPTLDAIQGNGDLTVGGTVTIGAGATPNANCVLTVPSFPLTATGLATPYLLAGFNQGAAGPCNQLNGGQTAFVQGAVYDVVNNIPYVYNPLVIDLGATPGIPPVVPNMPAQHVVGLWFGFNGNIMQLLDNGAGSLAQGHCVQSAGLDASNFGEYSYCNAIEFYAVLNQAVQFGMLVVPQLATSPKDGNLCPTLRDFTIVDQDQSDQVTTTYIVNAANQLAQDTQANRAQFQITTPMPGVNFLANPSDNFLVAGLIDVALGCTPWLVVDLAQLTQSPQLTAPSVTAVPYQEIYAAQNARAPIALVPINDPMTMINGMTTFDINKVNSYRLGVNQPAAPTIISASPTNYCLRLYNLQPNRVMQDKPHTMLLNSPNQGTSTTLFGFLVARLNAASQALNCTQNAAAPFGGWLNKPAPFTFTVNANGQVVDTSVTINPQAVVPTVTAAMLQLTGNANLDAQQGNGDVVTATAAGQCLAAFTTGGFNGTWFGVGFVLAAGGAMLLAGLSLCLKSKGGSTSFTQMA